jgi:hypothetical protein
MPRRPTLPGSTANDREIVDWQRHDYYEIDVSVRDWKPFGHNRSAACLPLAKATNCVCSSSFRKFSSVASVGEGANESNEKTSSGQIFTPNGLQSHLNCNFLAAETPMLLYGLLA